MLHLLSWRQKSDFFLLLSLQVEDGSVLQPVNRALHSGVTEDSGMCRRLLNGHKIERETLGISWRQQSEMNFIVDVFIYVCYRAKFWVFFFTW